MYRIYKITNKQNVKIYIGQTSKTIIERFNEHIENANKNKQYTISKAIRKYGIDNFEIIEIDQCESKHEINEKEIYWIDYYNSSNREFGYNMTTGGEGGDTYSMLAKSQLSKIKNKISKSNSGGNNGNHTPINMIDTFTNEKIHFESGMDCQRYLIEHNITFKGRPYYDKARQNRLYKVQSLLNKRYGFYYDNDEIGRLSSYESKSGNVPKKITNLNTNEVFIGINKKEALEHFNLPLNVLNHGKNKLKNLGFIIEELT